MRLRILNCIFLIALISSIPLLAQHEVRINETFINTPANKAFKQLAEKYNIRINYNESTIKGVVINSTIKDADIHTAFTQMLKDTRLNFTFDTENIVILIFVKLSDSKVQPSGNLNKGKTKKYTISGYLEDSVSLEKLIGAGIVVKGTQTGTTTNTYGFYSLSLQEGEYEILFSYVGFQPIIKPISLHKDTFLTINLSDVKQINEVVVIANKNQNINSTQMSVNKILIKDIGKIPVVFGEADVIKTMQLLPGVKSGNEGSSGLYVRGGSSEQNLVLLDGTPVYYPYHLFGFFSVFNNDAINNISIIKGGFPAHYGGRLSSVVDIQMKEGNMKEFKGNINIGLISSKISLEGPIVKDKSSFILSARRTYADLLLNLFSGDKSSLYFYDLNLKLNYKISDNDRIYLSMYHGKDKIDKSLPIILPYQLSSLDINWDNTIVALRWNHLFTSKLFLNTTLTYSRFNYNVVTENDTTSGKQEVDVRHMTSYLNKFHSGIEDYTMKTDFFWIPDKSNYIKFGAEGILHTFVPSENKYDLKFNPNSEIKDTTYEQKAQEIRLYAEDEISLTSFLKFNMGIQYSSFFTQDVQYNSFEPRISATIITSEVNSVKLSYSKMSQYIHLLSNSSTGIPIDIWVPSSSLVEPEFSNSYGIGFNQIMKDFDLSIEGYYKDFDQLVEYKDNEIIIGNNKRWDEKVEEGKGYSYGIECMIEKKTGKTTGWISYTWSKSNRKFENINNGKEFPYKYDRRHDVSVVINHELPRHFNFGITWVYGTGYAYNLGVSKYQPTDYDTDLLFSWQDKYIVDNNVRNNFRLPAYHRMDLNFSHSKKKRWGERIISLSIYNVYNKQNPYAFFVDTKNNKIRQISLYPVIPTISYELRF